MEEKLELEKLAMEKIKNAQNSVSGDHYIWIQYMQLVLYMYCILSSCTSIIRVFQIESGWDNYACIYLCIRYVFKYSYFNSYHLNTCIICVEIDLSNLAFGIFLYIIGVNILICS